MARCLRRCARLGSPRVRGGRLPMIPWILLVALLLLLPVAGVAQSDEGTTAVPRTPWGHPDLQGIWNNATTTPLERPSDLAGKEFLTAEEVAGRDAQVAQTRSTDRPPREGTTGTYNEFWWERGKTAANRRTSLIVEPPDGQLPSLTPHGQKRMDALTAWRHGRGPSDSWEDRHMAERCIVYRGVPPFPTGYNNNYQIFQTPEYVVIFQEHIHDVRIIPLGGRPHISENVRLWLGDSRGHWEDDTLVVRTKNFSDKAFMRRVNGDPSEALYVVERFTRVSADLIDYHFTVEDPLTWTRPWSGDLPMTKIEGPVFEYACHEGNYSMTNLLAGARAEEKAAAEAATGSR